MKERVAIWISYDGSNFNGWQKQPKGRTVQGIIEAVLSSILDDQIVIHASGRTDAGVHAISQCATFDAKMIMPVSSLHTALMRRMPNDIVITDMKLVPDNFHARFSAVGKTYEYKIYTSEKSSPFKNRYHTHLPRVLNEADIRRAMKCFLGTHDFKGFMASGNSTNKTVRTIFNFDLEVKNDIWTFSITGDGFLYNMVRIIVGTLIQVGLGRAKPEEIPEIIKSGERSKAKWTAPPEGLYLKEVLYA